MTASDVHTLSAFDAELKRLNSTLVAMGRQAISQFRDAMEALDRRDSTLASDVIFRDRFVDANEESVNQQAVRLLALRNPMAHDLRLVVASLRIASDIERVADLIANDCRRILALNQLPPSQIRKPVERLARLVGQMFEDSLTAFEEKDPDLAIDVWRRDEQVDQLYSGSFREMLTYMMEDHRNISLCLHLIFIAKDIERIGDHATNIAEEVHYLAAGTPIPGTRPKADKSSYTLVTPPTGTPDPDTPPPGA